MKIRRAWSVPLSIAACLSLAPLASAATTSPGANSVFVSAIATLPAGVVSSSLLTGTITRGKRRTVVAVEGMLTNIGQQSGQRDELIFPTINGISIEPFGYSAQVNCPPLSASSVVCTTTGSWWLDLDAAEAANPGMFIGKALAITLTGVELTGNGDQGLRATLTARVQKK